MHRDLNDIIPPSRRRALDMERPADMERPSAVPPPPVPPVPSSYDPIEPAPPMPPIRRGRRSRGGFPYGTALIALLVVAACGVTLYLFAGAKVTVTPVMNPTTIAADLSATAGQGTLPFQVITVQKTATANVPAESTENASDPATGTITITNKQATPQALIKNTRFQSASGLIFRIHDSVSIPAGGSIQATVYADEAGDKYNIAPTTFTVPGLKGSKAYDLVTAQSSAPMAGGFSGQRPAVSQDTKSKQYATIQAKLATDLQKDLAARIPAGYVLVPGASMTAFTPQNDAAGASGTVTLAEEGTVTAVIFPADALASAIAYKSVGTYGGQPVTLAAVQGLTVKPAQPSIAPDATQFDFNISGATTIVWKVDQAKIAGAVAGKTRTAAEIALKSFPEVDKATLVLRPFWASHFPADPAKIKVNVATPSAGK